MKFDPYLSTSSDSVVPCFIPSFEYLISNFDFQMVLLECICSLRLYSVVLTLQTMLVNSIRPSQRRI